MNETTLLLAPAPKAPGEFLVTVECDDADLELPFEITLNQYSRDRSWIESPLWKKATVKIVPGQERRYPGFLKYIQERQKSAWGTFHTTSSNNKGIFLIPHTLKKEQQSHDIKQVYCHVGLDPRLLSQPTKPPQPPPQQKQQQQFTKTKPPIVTGNNNNNSRTTNNSSNKPSKSGLLGNLLGAQRRTNYHMDTTTGLKNQSSTNNESENMTTGQVIAKFRNQIEDKLTKFQSSSDTFILKIPVSLADQTANLAPDEELTMDILKFIIHEQVEEVDDRWIAIREPSEFVDEASFVVYKEGHCPEEVLQEYNKGDLPDEIKGQQRAIRDVSAKAEQKKLQKVQRNNEKSAHTTNTNITTALNTKKRDRRTIEEIQRGMTKRPKS